MSLDTANLIWAIALGLGATVWLFAVLRHRRAFGADTKHRSGGSVNVPVSPSTASQVLAQVLAQGSQLLQVRITRADEQSMEAQIGLPVTPGKGGFFLEKGRAQLRCRFLPGLSGCTIHYELDSRELLSGLARWSRILLFLGVVAIGAVAVLMPLFVIPSHNPAIRGQVVQSIQMVHFLWPPFLIAYLSRRIRGMLEMRVQDIFANLPHLILALAAKESS